MLEENSQFTFFKRFSSKIAIFLVIIIALAIFAEKKWEHKKSGEKNDCFRAAKVFSELQMGHSLSRESLEEIGDIVGRRPYLRPKYEQLVGFALLAQQQEERALSHMAAAFKRHESAKEPVQDFAKLTLLIEQKEYEEALVLAKDLNIRFENSGEYPGLHLCNLLRTLFLAKESHDVLLTKVTWDKVERHPSWPYFAPLFQEGELTLQNYLNQ